MRRRASNKIQLSSIMLAFLVCLAMNTSAQDKKKVEYSLTTDLVSRYVWRGTQYSGDYPSIQPNLTLKYRNFSLGSWSSYSLAGDHVTQELDLFASYTFKDELFTIGLTDYFFPNSGVDYSYFDYGAPSTGHVLEAAFTYNGVKKFPLSAMLAVNFFGADAARIDSDPNSVNFNQKIGLQYSNYLELSYPWKVENVDIKATAGFTFTNPRQPDAASGYLGEAGYYSSKAGLVNLGVKVAKSLKITDEFSLPVNGSFIVNPLSKKVFFVLGISF